MRCMFFEDVKEKQRYWTIPEIAKMSRACGRTSMQIRYRAWVLGLRPDVRVGHAYGWSDDNVDRIIQSFKDDL